MAFQDLRDAWVGLVSASRSNTWDVELGSPVIPSNPGDGSSGAFLGIGKDDVRYWIKTTNNLHSAKLPITEQVVARLGHLLGDMTCEVKRIYIPEDLEGWEFLPGFALYPGIAHASTSIPGAVVSREISRYNRQDDNRVRLVIFCAICDWCVGNDHQLLLSADEDCRFYSHDHGHFFPGGPDWSIDTLVYYADHVAGLTGLDLDAIQIHDVAERLRSVTRQDIAEVLALMPSSWAASNEELEVLGAFLEHRVEPVADRLHALIGGQQ
jgi:hypothetical protein